MFALRLIFISSLWIQLCYAQSDDAVDSIDDLAGELAECAAYYATVSLSVEGIETDLARRLRSSSNEASKYAYDMSLVFSSEEVTNARMNTAARLMAEEIDYDFSRLSVLINKYGFDCRDLLNEVPARFKKSLEEPPYE